LGRFIGNHDEMQTAQKLVTASYGVKELAAPIDVVCMVLNDQQQRVHSGHHAICSPDCEHHCQWQAREIHRTEVIKDNLDPEWHEATGVLWVFSYPKSWPIN
jgi:hypothetical protein